MKEEIYIIVDGRENGKKWIDCSKDANKAGDLADLLCFILEELNEEEQSMVKHFVHAIKSRRLLKTDFCANSVQKSKANS